MAKRYGGCQQNDECDGTNHCGTIVPLGQARGNPFGSGKALLSASSGFIPAAAIPVHAEPRTHRRNDHGMFRFNHFVHHAVRESLRVTPSDIPRLVPTTMEVRIFCQSIPNANNFLNKIRPRTGCWASYQAVASTAPGSTSGRNSTRHFIWRTRTKSCFCFLQRNSGTGGLLILRKSLLHQGCQPKYQSRYATFKSIPTQCQK